MIGAHFASLKEKKTFLLDEAFCLGMHKHKPMAYDANTNNATKKNFKSYIKKTIRFS